MLEHSRLQQRLPVCLFPISPQLCPFLYTQRLSVVSAVLCGILGAGQTCREVTIQQKPSAYDGIDIPATSLVGGPLRGVSYRISPRPQGPAVVNSLCNVYWPPPLPRLTFPLYTWCVLGETQQRCERMRPALRTESNLG